MAGKSRRRRLNTFQSKVCFSIIKIITEKINRSKGDKGRFFVTCYSCTRPLEGRNQKSSACPAPHNLYTPPRGAESLLRNAFPTIHKINKVKTGGQIQKDRPPFVCSFPMFLPDIPFRSPEARHGVFPVHLCYDKGVKTIKNKYLTRAMSRKVHRMRLRKEHFPCPIC